MIDRLGGKSRQASVAERVPPTWDRGTFLLLVAVIGAGLLSALHLAVGAFADPDELEHLHATWLWAQGLQPYTDFFEHHPPLYWLILRPILYSVHDRDLIQLCLNARLFSWVVNAGTILVSWWLFASLFGRCAAWCGAALLAATFGVQAHAVAIRPDGLSLLLAIAGSALLINGLGQGMGREAVSFWRLAAGGILLGTGLCLLAKVLFWVIAVAIPPVILLIYGRGSPGGRKVYAAGAAMLAAGVALPLAVQLVWAIAANDPALFWYCNVTVNSRLTGSVLAVPSALSETANVAFRLPMISIPLAIAGAAQVLTTDTSAVRFRSLTGVLLVISSIILILLANGPFQQYYLPLFVAVSGLSGVALQLLLGQLRLRGRWLAIGLLLVIEVVSWYLLVHCRVDLHQMSLRQTLRPLQAILDRSGPEDTYVSLQHCNPVFMMDSDPQQFMKPACFGDDPRMIRQIAQTITEKRPSFLVGSGIGIWTPRSGVVTIHPDPSIPALYELRDQTWGILQRKGR